jgi:hypothetical protein
MKEFIQSKIFKIVAAIIGGFLIVIIIFSAGVSVGLHKARFSADFGRNYERNFMGSRFDNKDDDRNRGGTMIGHPGFVGNMMNQIEGRDLRNAHGLSGSIVSITDNNIIIKDVNDRESTVTVSEKTLIKSQTDNLQLSDLKVDDQIVIIGNPDENGTVNASLIRIFPNSLIN